jgi:hypothetical protein
MGELLNAARLTRFLKLDRSVSLFHNVDIKPRTR